MWATIIPKVNVCYIISLPIAPDTTLLQDLLHNTKCLWYILLEPFVNMTPPWPYIPFFICILGYKIKLFLFLQPFCMMSASFIVLAHWNPLLTILNSGYYYFFFFTRMFKISHIKEFECMQWNTVLMESLDPKWAFFFSSDSCVLGSCFLCFFRETFQYWQLATSIATSYDFLQYW